MEEKYVSLLENDVPEELKVEIVYVKVSCSKCLHEWGISIRNNQVSKRDLVCRDCAGDYFFSHKFSE